MLLLLLGGSFFFNVVAFVCLFVCFLLLLFFCFLCFFFNFFKNYLFYLDRKNERNKAYSNHDHTGQKSIRASIVRIDDHDRCDAIVIRVRSVTMGASAARGSVN